MQRDLKSAINLEMSQYKKKLFAVLLLLTEAGAKPTGFCTSLNSPTDTV
jgi:hypothetical protein